MTAPYPTTEDLHAALLHALDPITRWRTPPPSESGPVLVNDVGVDHWVEHVTDVRLDPDGRAHPLIVTYTDAGATRRRRAGTGQGTHLAWGVTLTIAGGDPWRARWALDRARHALDGTRLTDPDGRAITAPLTETFGEGFPITPDGDLAAGHTPRWETTLRYATTAHQPTP